MRNRRIAQLALAALLLAPPAMAADATPIGFDLIRTYPHDRAAFTQGLVFADGRLYEGTGGHGRSSIRLVDLTTGTVRKRELLALRYFGEGITIYGDRLIQLTWQAGKGFVYDRASLARIDEFSYPGQGWGLTHDGHRLIMSDGTPRLRFLDPFSFVPQGELQVRDASGPVTGLNELEYVDGFVFANVYQTDRIVKIDPLSGVVVGWLDISSLSRHARRAADAGVANGIAYDATARQLLLTGKLWPYLYVIEIRQLR